MALSRDTVSLEIQDTVVLRAEAQDVNGDPILNAPITWSLVDPGVADLALRGSSVRLTGTHAGATRLAAVTGSFADTAFITVPPALTATTLSVQLDTLTALGDTLAAGVSSQSPAGSRLGTYTVTVTNPAVAQAVLDGADLRITATTPGQTYVRVVERRGTRDSLRLVVQQREAIMELTPPVAGNYVGRTQQLAAIVKDRRGNIIPGVAITFRSFDTTIVTVSPIGLLTFVGPGTTAVEARGAGGSTDTSTVAVPQTARLLLREAAESIGTGLLSETEWVAADGIGGTSPWATLTVLNPSIAQAPDSVLYANAGAFQIIGKQPGTTKLIASSPSMIPDTMIVFVSTSHLHFGDWDFPGRQRLVPLGSEARASVVAQDSLGRTADPSGQVAISIVARDTNVVRLPQNQDPYILGPIGQGVRLFPVVPVDTGRTWVVATATGFRADSVLYIVTSLPKVVFTKGPVHMLGAGQRNIDGAAFGTTRGWDHGGDVLVTFTRRHPGVATFPDTLTLPSNALYWPLSYIGRTPGVDTIIASAPGYEPDTTVLYVTTPRFRLVSDTAHGTTLGGFAGFYVADSLGGIHSTDAALPIVVTPADTSIARPATTTMPALWGTSWGVGLQAVDTGTTTVTVTDSAGLYTPSTYTLMIALDSSFQIEAYDGYELGPPAPRQRFYPTTFVLRIPPSPAPGRVAHLRATNPRVLHLPDSVVVQGTGFNYFEAAAGDTVGTSRIIVSSPGFVTDTSAPIAVVEGQLRLTGPDSAFIGEGDSVQVATRASCNFNLVLDTAATFTLRALDPGLVIDSTVMIAAGQICRRVPVRFTVPGNLRIAVEDRRAVPAPYRGDTIIVRSKRPRLQLLSQAPTVGVGQRMQPFLTRDGRGTDSLFVTIAHSSGHTSTTPQTLMGPGVFTVFPPVNGVSVGKDTLMVSGTGYDGDTLVISVTDGTIALSGWPTQIKQGDSVKVTMFAEDSNGVVHLVTEPTTFAITKQGGITFSKNNEEISTFTIPAGLTSNFFYVRATGVTGPASARFVNLHYIEQIFSVTVTP